MNSAINRFKKMRIKRIRKDNCVKTFPIIIGYFVPETNANIFKKPTIVAGFFFHHILTSSTSLLILDFQASCYLPIMRENLQATSFCSCEFITQLNYRVHQGKENFLDYRFLNKHPHCSPLSWSYERRLNLFACLYLIYVIISFFCF